jgi:hypothetical protein
MTSPLDDLTKLLGILQTASPVQAKRWASETRQLINKGQPEGAAATMAAKKVFSDFDPLKFDKMKAADWINDLLNSIDQLA